MNSTPTATRTRTRRTGAAAVAALVLAGIVTAAGPAAAAPSCTPRIQVLASLGTGGYSVGNEQTEGVLGLGTGTLSVGVSGGRPVYWTGTRLHKVPLPGADPSGAVLAVNKSGLMVGAAHGADGYLFTYRAGDAAVTRLPGSDWLSDDADVNDAGYVVSRTRPGTGTVWKDGRKVRDLAVPADAAPGTRIELVSGINNKGDVIGMAREDYEVPETGQRLEGSYPVLWPADGGPAKALSRTSNDSWVQDIDESGRVVGYDWYGMGYQFRPVAWTPPYAGPVDAPGALKTHPYGTFEAVSPTTGVSVGTAKFHPDIQTLPDQAQLWTGTGPVLALPRLAANQAATAQSAADDGRVGGAAVNTGGTLKPVIWTCATKQAYLPK
ncbi:hypothetical protein EF910_04405 [Streptomyces sp. WAC07149]|uniref:hypothetical protein n=1 Tax=Streptomyces sp. WAC07149 TaxID=2487425 RepID=UPI000F796D3F|nr:hypothetical protein [Streptomyces sp. WAC07149]RST07704.1 hypothetical protein EF910_04405 [Streptomyces sp. WAC07149]